MFLTYSASDERLNTAIVGGRNIHDGFVFKDAVDLSKYPDLVQYPVDESYAYWQDMEYQITDSQMVKSMLSHYMTLWELDGLTFYQRSVNLNIPTAKQVQPTYFEQKEPLVRHLMSIPFKDQQSLERFYVDMFDSAQKEIHLSTPYFNITKPISDAISRALERGVKMSLITRLDLKGDTVDFILSDVNKKAVNKFKDKFQVFEYTVPNEILHSKVVLVDGKLAFVGSVNLNRRSFIHDTENGILVYSSEFYQKMFDILGTYMKTSRLVKDKQKLKFINKMILSIPLINDAL
jgi:cardiolipin synthase